MAKGFNTNLNIPGPVRQESRRGTYSMPPTNVTFRPVNKSGISEAGASAFLRSKLGTQEVTHAHVGVITEAKMVVFEGGGHPDDVNMWRALGFKPDFAHTVSSKGSGTSGVLGEGVTTLFQVKPDGKDFKARVFLGTGEAENGESLSDLIVSLPEIILGVPDAPKVVYGVSPDIQAKAARKWRNHYSMALKTNPHVSEMVTVAGIKDVVETTRPGDPARALIREVLRISLETHLATLTHEFDGQTEESFKAKWPKGVDPRRPDSEPNWVFKTINRAFSGIVYVAGAFGGTVDTATQIINQALDDQMRPLQEARQTGRSVKEARGNEIVVSPGPAQTAALFDGESGPAIPPICMVGGVSFDTDVSGGVFDKSVWEVAANNLETQLVQAAIIMYEEGVDPLPFVADTKPEVVRAHAEVMGIKDENAIKEGLSGLLGYRIKTALAGCESVNETAVELLGMQIGLARSPNGTFSRIDEKGRIIQEGISLDQVKAETSLGKLFSVLMRGFSDECGTSDPTSVPAVEMQSTVIPATPITPEVGIVYPEVALSEASDALLFTNECVDVECAKLDSSSLFGWKMGGADFMFFNTIDDPELTLGRQKIGDVWFPIFGSFVNIGGELHQLWDIPTSGATPVPEMGIDVFNSKNVLAINLSGIARGEDIVVQYTDPTPGSKPEIFVIKANTELWNGFKNASPVAVNNTNLAEPTPVYPLFSAMDKLLDEGIGTTAEGVADGELLRLVVGEGEDQVVVPGAFFDEEGKFLHIQVGDMDYQIAVDDADDRLELTPDGKLLLNNSEGENIAMFDVLNAEAGWVEMKQFPSCDAEHYMGCYIPPQDLQNGTYFRWLEQLPMSVLANPDPTNKPGGGYDYFIHGWKKVLKNEYGTKDIFAIGSTFGYTEGDLIRADGTLVHTNFIVVPVEFAVPDKPGETRWVVFVIQKFFDWSESKWISELEKLVNDERIRISGFDPSKINNSFNKQTLAKFPDIYERVTNFRNTLDPDFISEPGLVLELRLLGK